MRDYIPKKKDINGDLGTVTVKQFDNNSRLLHVTLSDNDLADGTYGDSDAFVLEECTAALYIQPEGNDDPERVQFVAGEVADGENGVVTFLLPGGVTQVVGRYKCEIWIYGGDETQPIISTKPFALIVEKSIRNDSAIEATQSMSALDAKIQQVNALQSQVNTLISLADSGDITPGSAEAEVIAARTGWNGAVYATLGDAIRVQVDHASQYRAGINAQYGTYHSHVYEYTKEGTFYATQYDNSGNEPVRRWDDLPDQTADFIIRNTRYGDNWVLQTAIQANSPGAVYQRVVPRSEASGNHPWYFIGQPTASQINNAVSGWLDAHPEATTTVQDGSVTKSKFAAALASEIDGKADSTKLAFVTPEMFDAVGDGVTDDYQAIQDCIDYAFEHNARVEFSRKTYAVSDTVKLYGNCVYNGNNCTIKQTSDVPTMGTYKYFDSSKESKHVTINDFWLEGNVNNANNDGLILCGWYERVNHVNVQNVGGHGMVVTSYLANGNEINSSTHTLVEGMILNSKFRSTNPDKYPFYVHCSDSFMITDWRVKNSIFASADCPCFMWFDRIAGWFLTDVQCYGNARNYGIYAHFASGTHMENITLDGIMDTGIYFGAQLGSCHATNVHIVVSAGVTGEIYAIRQTGGSSNPAALAIANIDVNVKSDTTPSALYLHRGSSYIFDVVNPVFVKDHAEISYQYFYYLGDNSVFRLNGFKILSNTPVTESTENFSRHYSTVTYSRESTTLTLTVTPSTTIDNAGLLLIAGEVNGASKGNSVYSVGLFHRGTVMPCQLISEQSGFEFTDVGVSYDSSTNTYTIVATTPNTDNCRYSMNVIF